MIAATLWKTDLPVVREICGDKGVPVEKVLGEFLHAYLHSLSADRGELISRYRIIDVVRKVVEGAGGGDPFFIQAKSCRIARLCARAIEWTKAQLRGFSNPCNHYTNPRCPPRNDLVRLAQVCGATRHNTLCVDPAVVGLDQLNR
jgi:hypothetical protein